MRLKYPSMTLLTTVIYFILVSSLEPAFSTNFLWDKITSAIGLMQLFYYLVLFYLLTLNRFIFFVSIPIIFVFSTLSLYYTQQLGIQIDQHIISAVFLTQWREAVEIVSSEIILLSLLSLVLSGLLLSYYQYAYKKHKLALDQQEIKASFLKQYRFLLFSVVLLFILLRLYVYPSNFILRSFTPPVIAIPTAKERINDLADFFWPQQAYTKIRQSTVKGRRQYDVYHKENNNRLRVHASRGFFSIKNNYIKRTYHPNGNLLAIKIYWPKTLKPFLINNFMPFSLIQEVWLAVQHFYTSLNTNFIDISQNPSASDASRTNNLTIVFIIGESARADHFQLNGYQRKTTPRLIDEVNLVNFSDVTSCSASTYISVPCMLTRMSSSDLPSNYKNSDTKAYLYQPMTAENSLISLFNKHGFFTAWHSMNKKFGLKDVPISRVLYDAQQVTFKEGSRDSRLLPGLDKLLKSTENKKLIILHTLGSHWKYNARASKRFRQFKPICKSSLPSQCPQDRLVNSYDNSVLYTDYFISEVINRLKDDKAIVLYSSDHGESLGENGFYTHSVMSQIEQRKVPMLWWVSNQLKQEQPQLLQNLQSNQAKATSHESIFHSLLDCSGIQSAIIDKSLSLCQKKALFK